MERPTVAKEVEIHVRHILLEGWTDIWHMIYATEGDTFVLALEYVDDEGKNRAGQNWVVEPEELDDIRFLIYELGIPSLKEDGSRPGSEDL